MWTTEDGYLERRYDTMSEPWFWLLAIPLVALWIWWDKRAQKRLGREFTPFERTKRDFFVTMGGLAVVGMFGLVVFAVRNWL